jgi:hypothetical protein
MMNMDIWYSKNKKTNLTRNIFATGLFYKFLIAILITIISGAASASAVKVTSGDYLVQMLTEPSPPIAGQETLITLKVLHARDGLPARHGKVLVKISEVEETEEIDRTVSEDLATFNKAKERDEYGNYEFTGIFAKHANYHIDFVIPEIEGNRLASPLRASYTALAAPVGYAGLRMLFVLSTVLIIFGVFVFFVHAKLKKQSTDPAGFNLLYLELFSAAFPDTITHNIWCPSFSGFF